MPISLAALVNLAGILVSSTPVQAQKAKEASPSSAPATPASQASPRLNVEIPVVEGEDTLGIRIPHRDPSGRLILQLSAEKARKIADNEIEMEDVVIEFYDKDGQKFLLQMPQCSFDVQSKTLSGNQTAVISRSDFKIIGQSIYFDLDAQSGQMGGPVTMTLYNIQLKQ